MSDIHQEDSAIIEAGYKPQLHRSLGFFASFAIPFSVISITTGIFANYGYVLGKGGPFGFWTWVIVSIGYICVALVMAEMAARVPLTGSVYNWNNRLANPFIGWMAGWFAISNMTIATAAVTTTILPVLGILLGHDVAPRTGAYVSSILILVQMAINLCGVRLTSYTNIVAVIAEIVSIVVLSLLVIIAVLHHGQFNTALLVTIPDSPRPYLPAFLMSSLIGAFCLVGFETAADVSEETINAHKISPRGVISSILASTIIGFAFIVVMTLAIPNLDEISKASYPLAAIASYHLGDRATNVFLIFAAIAMFSCSMVCMTAASRMLFAMARDGRFLASKLLGKISPRHVPSAPIILVAVVGCGFTFIEDPTALYGATSVCGALYYLITVISFAFKTNKLPQPAGTFSLGSWHWPVVAIATVVLLTETCILTLPAEFHTVTEATGFILTVGLALYAMVGRLSKPSPAASPRR